MGHEEDFHKIYKRNTPWWRVINAEFELIEPYHRFIGLFGYEYEDEYVCLCKNGYLIIKPNFRWGASGLTIDNKSTREASLVHDALYHLSDTGLFSGKKSEEIRGFSDSLLYKILIENGTWSVRAKMWLYAVDTFGDSYWES